MNIKISRIFPFLVGMTLALTICKPVQAQAPITGGTYTGTNGTPGSGARLRPPTHPPILPGTGGNGLTFSDINYTQLISDGFFTGGIGGTPIAGTNGGTYGPTTPGQTGGMGGNGVLVAGSSVVDIMGGTFTGGDGANGANGPAGARNGTVFPTGQPGGPGADGSDGGAAGSGLSVTSAGTVDITGGTFIGGTGGNGGNGGNGGTSIEGPGGQGGNAGSGGAAGFGLLVSGAGTIIDISGGTFSTGNVGDAGTPGAGDSGNGGYGSGPDGNSGNNGADGYGIYVENGATVYIVGTNFSFTNGIVTATLADGSAFTTTAFIGPGGGTIGLAPSAVPEPGSFALLGSLGLTGIALLMRRRRNL